MSKILVCHPDEATRESLKLILCDTYEMILTDTMSQSIDCLEHADISVFLLNLDATREFGLANITKFVKSHPKLKVISISESKVKAKVEEALDNGVVGNIAKPFKNDEILKLIKKHS